MPQDPQATKLGHHIISCSWNSALVKPPFSSIFVGQLSIFPSEVSRFVASIPTSGLFLAYFWVWISTVCWWSPVINLSSALPASRVWQAPRHDAMVGNGGEGAVSGLHLLHVPPTKTPRAHRCDLDPLKTDWDAIFWWFFVLDFMKLHGVKWGSTTKHGDGITNGDWSWIPDGFLLVSSYNTQDVWWYLYSWIGKHKPQQT